MALRKDITALPQAGCAGTEIRFSQVKNQHFEGDKYHGLKLVVLDARGCQFVQLAWISNVQLDCNKLEGGSKDYFEYIESDMSNSMRVVVTCNFARKQISNWLPL